MSAEMGFGGPFNKLLVSVVNLKNDHMMLNFIISKMLSMKEFSWNSLKIHSFLPIPGGRFLEVVCKFEGFLTLFFF